MKKLIVSLLCLFPLKLFANVSGSDLQNFNPTTNGLGFITVHSSETLYPLELNAGTFVTYTTNSLAYSTVSGAPNNQTFSEPNDRLLYSNIHFGLGIIKGWDVGFSAGFINSQDIEQSNFLFSYGDTGINEFNLNTKVRLINKEDWAVAVVGGIDIEQIKNNPFTGDDAGPSFNFEAVADVFLTKKLLWAVNFGYRLRLEGTPIPNTGVTPMSDQWIYSTALSYQTDDLGSAIIGEFFGSYPLEEFTIPTDRQLSNLEAVVGYRWRVFKTLDIHGGFGTEMYHGLGSPDFRAFIGFNARFDFLGSSVGLRGDSSESHTQPYTSAEAEEKQNNFNDSDNDGVPDAIDQCPSTSDQSYVDEKGCATKSLPKKGSSIDSDQDGVNDSGDRCGQTPLGVQVNGFGCEIKEYDR